MRRTSDTALATVASWAAGEIVEVAGCSRGTPADACLENGTSYLFVVAVARTAVQRWMECQLVAWSLDMEALLELLLRRIVSGKNVRCVLRRHNSCRYDPSVVQFAPPEKTFETEVTVETIVEDKQGSTVAI